MMLNINKNRKIREGRLLEYEGEQADEIIHDKVRLFVAHCGEEGGGGEGEKEKIRKSKKES